MSKYIEIFKIGLKEQTAYRFDVITSAVLSIAKLLLAYILWTAIFKGKETIGGYTFNMMLTYYMAINFFSGLEKSKDVLWQFYSEIRKGQFTKYIVRPINPIGVFISLSLSKTTYVIGINSLALVVWLSIFRKHIYIPKLSHLLIALCFMVIGLLIMIQLNYLITMLSFKIVEIAGVFFAVLNIISFLSGELVPLDFLPEFIVNIAKLLPFYYILYFPASILLGFNEGSVLSSLLIICGWLLFFTGLNQIMFKRLFRFYEGVGI